MAATSAPPCLLPSDSHRDGPRRCVGATPCEGAILPRQPPLNRRRLGAVAPTNSVVISDVSAGTSERRGSYANLFRSCGTSQSPMRTPSVGVLTAGGHPRPRGTTRSLEPRHRGCGVSAEGRRVAPHRVRRALLRRARVHRQPGGLLRDALRGAHLAPAPPTSTTLTATVKQSTILRSAERLCGHNVVQIMTMVLRILPRFVMRKIGF